MTKFGLDSVDIEKINSVFSEFPEIENVIIYGSRAKGNYRENSDIDLVLVGKNLSHTLICEVNQRIDNLLLPYLFDISILNQISNKELIEHIERVGCSFYEKNKSN